MIAATASREPVLHRPQVEHALRLRRHRPMLLLDLAVPRDIAHDVSGLRDVFLYTVDDLERAIEDNRRSRREAAEQAEAIVELQTAHFVEQLQAQGRQQPVDAPARAWRGRAPRPWPRRASNWPRDAAGAGAGTACAHP